MHDVHVMVHTCCRRHFFRSSRCKEAARKEKEEKKTRRRKRKKRKMASDDDLKKLMGNAKSIASVSFVERQLKKRLRKDVQLQKVKIK